MPKPTIEPWRLPDKPLQLELQQEFADRAIIGGVTGFVQTWTQQALAAVSAPDLRTALAQLSADAAGYADLGRPARKAFVAEVQRLAGLVAKEAGARPKLSLIHI